MAWWELLLTVLGSLTGGFIAELAAFYIRRRVKRKTFFYSAVFEGSKLLEKVEFDQIRKVLTPWERVSKTDDLFNKLNSHFSLRILSAEIISDVAILKDPYHDTTSFLANNIKYYKGKQKDELLALLNEVDVLISFSKVKLEFMYIKSLSVNYMVFAENVYREFSQLMFQLLISMKGIPAEMTRSFVHSIKLSEKDESEFLEYLQTKTQG